MIDMSPIEFVSILEALAEMGPLELALFVAAGCLVGLWTHLKKRAEDPGRQREVDGRPVQVLDRAGKVLRDFALLAPDGEGTWHPDQHDLVRVPMDWGGRRILVLDLGGNPIGRGMLILHPTRISTFQL